MTCRTNGMKCAHKIYFKITMITFLSNPSFISAGTFLLQCHQVVGMKVEH